MKVVDHEQCASWFLLKRGDALFLDVLCDYGSLSYSVMIELSDREESLYSQEGHDYLNWLAGNVQRLNLSREYQLRDVKATYLQEYTEAVNEWLATQQSS